jgi:hypothetical protein
MFLFSTAFRPILKPTQPPTQWVPGALFQWVTRQGQEADHSSPLSAEITNTGAILPLPHMFLGRSAQLITCKG